MTSHWPLAPAYGAQQRVLNLAKLLMRFGDLSFALIPTELEDEGTVLRTTRDFNVRQVIRPVSTETSRSFSERFRHEFDPTHMATDPYVVSDADRRGFQELLGQHDLVWVHTVRPANWLRIWKWPNSVLDVDDLISRQLLSAVQTGCKPIESLLNLRRAWIWRNREKRFIQRFSVLTVCSQDDRKYLGNHERIHVIPNGSDPFLITRPCSSPQLPRIGLIGNCTFPPNEEGVKWFIRDVWPLIKRQYPDVQLRLVGRGSEGYLTKLGPDIAGLGWMEDPTDEIDSWSAMIVPIKVGSGTRVKLAEGFARRCPIVSTEIGAFGYDVKNGEELLLADRAEDFATACLRILKNPQLGEALAQRAHSRFLECWTWSSFENTVGLVVRQSLEGYNRLQPDQSTMEIRRAMRM